MFWRGDLEGHDDLHKPLFVRNKQEDENNFQEVNQQNSSNRFFTPSSPPPFFVILAEHFFQKENENEENSGNVICCPSRGDADRFFGIFTKVGTLRQARQSPANTSCPHPSTPHGH
jgi:hypothetical protein